MPTVVKFFVAAKVAPTLRGGASRSSLATAQLRQECRSYMLWLPALDVDGCPRRLPLGDRSAPALAALLVDGAGREPQIAAREAVEADPPLALWTLVRSAQHGCDELKTTEALADWLARHAGQVLRWPEGAEAAPIERDWMDGCDRLRWQSLAVARRARELAEGSEAADEAFLLGLVHAADKWWTLDAGRGPTDDVATRAAAPPWLAAALVQLARPSPDLSGPAAHVLRARQSVDELPTPGDDRPPSANSGEAAIAASLPKLAALLALCEQLRHDFERQLETEKLEAMAEFAAGAGHEINNPLAVIAGRAQLLIADEANPERRRELAVMNTQAMRVFEMISDMMLFARPPRPQLADCDLSAIVARVSSDLAAKVAERNVSLERIGDDEPLMAVADAVQLAVALRALCDNALNVLGRGGKLTLAIERGIRDGRCAETVITVRDTGPGIPAAVRRHLFDPFYSGRRAGRGLGMGLAKCWRIVTNHGGTLDVESGHEQGATFTIRLPM